MESQDIRKETDVRTVGEAMEDLLPGVLQCGRMPTWPPDVFAIAAYLLRESGAYLRVVEQWPPTPRSFPDGFPGLDDGWVDEVHGLAREWRDSLESPPNPLPSWWSLILKRRKTLLREIQSTPELLHALLHLCSVADEASVGVGIWRPRASGKTEDFRKRAEDLLLPDRELGSTLCAEIDRSRARILPKCHTPQTGISVRSLSHHLSLWTAQDVTPFWWTARPPWWWTTDSHGREVPVHSINLLLFPWPKLTAPTAFQPAKPVRGALDNMPSSFGFFRYQRQPARADEVELQLRALYRAAGRLTDRIDGIVLPEMALHQTEYEAIRGWTADERSFLIAGIHGPNGPSDNPSGPGCNYLALEIPLSDEHYLEGRQDKHHRWRLDRSQIVQYGLGGQLDPEKSWWEYSATEGRNLAIVSMLPWMSLCALVCEDLARQDPVSRLVRSVGPNLVIALLMDGPQLASRWPARYATVLAEDPGSSVLTLTSFGMCSRSRPPGYSPSRTVALWKDARSGKAVEIDLEPDADGILLNLVRTMGEEWTADGRGDHGAAGYPTLAGIHPVRITSDDREHVEQELKKEASNAPIVGNEGDL